MTSIGPSPAKQTPCRGSCSPLIKGRYRPALLAESGCGDADRRDTDRSYRRRQRFPTDAHFARQAGVAPIPVSSGRKDRHRLHRGGDRQLNRALHVIAITRARHRPRDPRLPQRKTSRGQDQPRGHTLPQAPPRTPHPPTPLDAPNHPHRRHEPAEHRNFRALLDIGATYDGRCPWRIAVLLPMAGEDRSSARARASRPRRARLRGVMPIASRKSAACVRRRCAHCAHPRPGVPNSAYHSLVPDWREYWRAPPLERRKPCDLQGVREYRYRDSNPGFRHERAAS